MTAATLQLNNARLRGQIVNSTVEIVRNELDRNANSVAVVFYARLSKYEFKRFRGAVDAANCPELPHTGLAQLGQRLSEKAEQLKTRLQRLDRVRSSLRWSERLALDYVRALATELQAYGTELQHRALTVESLGSNTPMLSGRLAYQAGMGSLFMRPAARDSAEALPDPDYGI